ncbi:alpha-amylase family glycosyl hydrolase [soil metagenome]
MYKLARIIYLFVLFCTVFSCKNSPQQQKSENPKADTATIDGHPAWIMQGNIYEVNVRQYTPEGTFKAFAVNLQRLKDMGVQTLWFMPINPISKVARKGVLGSYYAVSNYTAINSEFGTIDDWKALVTQCHNMGFKVIIDWVPSHTGADHYWLEKHPDFYVRDSITGKAISLYDWTDTRKLNYKNPVLVDSIINSMKFWIRETDIDGFRCDVAGEVPDDYWKKCIPELRAMKNIFMLAEGNKPSLPEDGFDATYTWNEFNMMKLIAKGARPAFAMDSVIRMVDTSFPENALLMYFTSNHDENSWNKADYATMPGASHAPFAVLTQTIGRSVPLIYSGQEEPFLDSVSFFYKDTITFGKYARGDFYKTLLDLRNENNALAANAAFKKVKSNNDSAVYAFERVAGNNRLLVLLNLTNKEQKASLPGVDIEGMPKNVFIGKPEQLKNGQEFILKPWDYIVYSY